MNTSRSERADARDYRIADILGDGSAILDAEDLIMEHHRRVVAARVIPAGARTGASVRCWDDGRIELLAAFASVDACGGWLAELPMDEIVSLSPKFGPIIRATVATVAREFDLSVQIAAHIIHTWIKIEYLL